MLPPARPSTAAPAPSTSFTTLAYDVYTLGARLLHKQEQHHHNKAMVTAVLSLGSLVLMTAVSVQFSFVIAAWTTALTDKKQDEFYALTWRIGWFLLAWLPLNVLDTFLSSSLRLQLRQILGQSLIARYFASKSYFHVTNVSNAGSRILEVNLWIKRCQKLVFLFLGHVVNLIAYSALLAHIGYRLLGAITVFSVGATFFAVWVFYPQLTRIATLMTRQRRDIEYTLVRVHECRESIAFQNGGPKEWDSVSTKFQDMIAEGWHQLNWLLGLEAFQFGIDRATSLLPYFVVAPLFFSGDVEYGAIGQSARAFYYVKSAMNFFLGQFDAFASLSSATARLKEVVDGLEVCEARNQSNTLHLLRTRGKSGKSGKNGKSGKRPKSVARRYQGKAKNALVIGARPKETVLSMHNVGLTTPIGEVLAKGVTFSIRTGEHLLITGRSGCGKSSLLRVFAGLWPLDKDGGRLGVNVDNDLIEYLPQTSYFPLGSLRDALLYPRRSCRRKKEGAGKEGKKGKEDEESEEGDEDTAEDEQEESGEEEDARLRQAMHDATIGYLVERVGGLDGSPIRWSEVLSVGEQQRLGFARIFAQRPLLLFADEATSALDMRTEVALYKKLTECVDTFVSVGHRDSLKKFHTAFLHRGESYVEGEEEGEEEVEGKGWTFTSGTGGT